MKRESEPKLTFWSIPPFRQRICETARSTKPRDVRSLVVTLYALLYWFYGMQLPVILIAGAMTVFGASTGITVVNPRLSLMIPAMLLCGLGSSIASGVTVWHLISRAMRTRGHKPGRWAIWGALAAGAPMLSEMGIAGEGQLPSVALDVIAALLFGAGVGAAACWALNYFQRGEVTDA